MKKYFQLIILLQVSTFLFAQNELDIKLTRTASSFQANVTAPAISNNEYQLDFNQGGIIKISNGASAIKNVLIKIQNRAKNSDNLFSKNKSIDSNEVYIIPFDNSIKIRDTSGTTGKEVQNKFKIIIGDSSFLIALKPATPTSPLSVPPTEKAKAYQPGIIFWDAKILADDTTSRETILNILSYYTSLNITKTNITSWPIAETSYPNNSFLKEYIEKEKILKPDPSVAHSGAPTTSMLSTFSSIGNLDVTNIADGFAKFIVKRAKQELSIAFFQKFDSEISKYPDLQTVFPQTYTALRAMGDQIYNYEAYMKTLRESFEKDLSTLPDNLETIINNHKDFFDKLPELKAILQSAFYIGQQVQDKQHPGNIIENYPINYLDDVNSNIKASFQTLILISTSLKNNSGNDSSYWSSFSDIKKLFSNDDMMLKIYLGLLEEVAKLQNITFNTANNTSLSLSDVIELSYPTLSSDLPKYKAYIKNLALKVQSMETKIKNLNKIDNDSVKLENYYTIVSNSLDLMKYLTEVENLPHFPSGLNIQGKTDKYFYIAQSSSNIVIDVNRRNYSSAIVNTIQIYDTIFNKTNNDAFTAMSYTPSRADLTVAEQTSEQNEFKDAQNKQSQTSDISRAIFKYGSFMAAVAQAKSSDDVENAVEAIALPSGSFTIKRETQFNVALNAYGGLYYGHEFMKGIKDKLVFNSYGITAPVGVSISWGQKAFLWFGKGHSSFSIFISLLDLGAVAAYRINNDSIAQVPTIQLEDIFSPGAFISIGIPKTPLSFNMGAQIGPNLREVTDAKNDYSNKTYIRLSASLCVDIPVLNFYTKSK